MTKQVHAIRLKLYTQNDCSVIVWPNDATKVCLQLMNPRRTWLSTQAGDSVWLKKDGDKTRQAVESVELYRVFPASENGRVGISRRHCDDHFGTVQASVAADLAKYERRPVLNCEY